MNNSWTVRFYNKGEFRVQDKGYDSYSTLSNDEQVWIDKLLSGEFNVEFPIEPKIGMQIQLSSFANIAPLSSAVAIMCYLDHFQNVTIEKMIIHSRYILLHLNIQDK